MTTCRFIPPYLVQQIASVQDDADLAHRGQSTLAIDEQLRRRRLIGPPRVEAVPGAASRDTGEDAWTIHTASNGTSLPGRPVRSAGEDKSGDVVVDEAYAGVVASLGLFRDEYGRSSYDDRGAPVVATVHYEQEYVNAFWDGRQLVFGDGDGKLFARFTKPVDVLAHEFTHAVTQHTSGFVYEGQPGALNESMSDVFSACVKQRLIGQSAAEADWLVGEGIFAPSVQGRALRSMSEPGTAYDDPKVGRDRQVAHLSDYVDTADDNGGVHINSGIPNRAFYLAATGIGGSSWEVTGRIWYAALTSGLGADADFAAFAEATVAAADETGVDSVREAVTNAWTEVGVEPGSRRSDAGRPSRPRRPRRRVAVRRSGGIAGMTTAGEVDLDTDPRSEEVRQLAERIDFASLAGSTDQPDRYVYAIDLEEEEFVVGEQALTPELSRLVSLVLDQPPR